MFFTKPSDHAGRNLTALSNLTATGQLEPATATQQFGLQVLGGGQSAGLLVDSGDSQVGLTPAAIDSIAFLSSRLHTQRTFLAALVLHPVLSCTTISVCIFVGHHSSTHVSMISV